MKPIRILRSILIALVAVAAIAQTPTKRALNHRDFDGWRTIQSQTISRDGKVLAYALMPQEGDGHLVIKNLTTGKERREAVGSPPPPAENQNFENPTEGPGIAARGLRISFSADGRYVIANYFPPKAETDKARRDRRPAAEMPRGGLLIIDLTNDSVSRLEGVSQFQVNQKGEPWLLYQKGAAPGGQPGESQNNDLDQGRGGGRGQTGAQGPRRRMGTELVIRDLRKGETGERKIADVTDYMVTEDGKLLVYVVSSRTEETNGVYTAALGTDTTATALLAGKGRYTRPIWDPDQKILVFLSDKDDAGQRDAKFKLYGWTRGSGAAAELVSASTPGFRPEWGIAERGQISFSRDSSRVFLSTAPLTALAAAARAPQSPSGRGEASTPPAAGSDQVVADLWHYQDDFIQPMQRVRANQERSRTYRAVFHLAEKKFVQLSDPAMAGVTPNDDGRWAMGTDDRPYRRMVDFDGNYADFYLINTLTGDRRKLLERHRGGGGGGGGRGGGGAGGSTTWSPDGKYYLTFRDKHWWIISIPDGKMTSITQAVQVPFYNDEDDHPAEPGSLGTAGWTRDSKWVILYDRYDVWAISPDGATRHKLTDGRAQKIQFRIQTLGGPGGGGPGGGGGGRAGGPAENTDDPDDDLRGIDPEKQVLLRAESLDTRDTGFYTMAKLIGAPPKRLVMGAKSYRVVGKAREADVVLATATTFNDPPDLHVTDPTFRDLKRVTEGNPQKGQLNWGTGEIVNYRNADGTPLKAALYKPEDFDPKKKYPMMVYIYERLSQGVHNFVPPRPNSSINISFYVSNGYLVLTPDIVYEVGYPGRSALKCVVPAVQAIIDRGYVNEKAIGIQGHSWGGYQTAYLITQTTLFAAAEAGAPVGNMISAYNGIRWESGLPRQFQYERTQSRIGGTIWEDTQKFIENSPIFHVQRVKTPLLILHDDQDGAVPWYQGIELFLSMRRAGKEVYMFNYNGEAHGLRRRPNQKDYTVRMQQFFDHFLKGAPKPDWMAKGIPYTEREAEKDKFKTIYSDPAGPGGQQ